MALLSQVISFSPDGGFKNVGTVVVAATGTVEVVATVEGVVVDAESEVLPHAASPKKRRRSKKAFFTVLFCQENDFLD
jgi:hypothetical protein